MSAHDTALADATLPPGVADGQATMPGLLRYRARHTPDRMALREKVRGIWQGVTWGDYFQKVQSFALYLRAQGFGPGDKLVIASDGSPEWFYADLAAQSLGGVTVGIYPTNPWPELQYIVRHCRAKVAVCGDQEQTDKVLEAMRQGDGLPDLRKVLTVDWKGMRHYTDECLMPFADALAQGHQLAANASDVAALAAAIERFTDAQWRHLSAEEKLILPAARRHLLDDDWREIETAFRQNAEFRVGSERDEAFKLLFVRLMNMASEDAQP